MLISHLRRPLAVVIACVIGATCLEACSSTDSTASGTALGVGATAVTGGVGGVAGPPPGRDVRLVGALQSYAPASADAVIQELASSGVAVYDTPTSASPVQPVQGTTSPIRLLRWQARNMALEASSGGGVRGADIDAGAPMSPGAPPFTYFIAAWVKAGKTHAAQVAQQLMGPQDWAHAPALTYPTLVTTLFSAEATGELAKDTAAIGPSGTATSTTSTTAFDPMPVQVELVDIASSPCTAVSDFVKQGFNSVFERLKLNPNFLGHTGVLGAVGNFLAGLWNGAVDLAKAIVSGIVDALTAPIVDLLRIAIGGVAVYNTVVDLVKRWTLSVSVDPIINRFGIAPGAGEQGAITITVSTAGQTEQWPVWLQDCAQALTGTELPSVAAAGSAVLWTLAGGDGLIVVNQPGGPTFETKVEQDLTSKLGYVTEVESEEQVRNGAEMHSFVHVTTGIERPAIGKLRELFTAFLTSHVPTLIAPIVNPFLTQYIADIARQLTTFVDTTGSANVLVIHHGPAVCKN